MENSAMSYKPTCSIELLKARAELYRLIRQFFAERHILEVDTPIISHAATTDVHLASIKTLRHIKGKEQIHYLQTSPEFAMKRLLASGSGPIYQICKVFRDDEHGRKHNSEFTMLEWYRPGFDLDQLMQETWDLVRYCLPKRFEFLHPNVISYKDAFYKSLNVNPLQADLKQLKKIVERKGLNLDLGDDRLGYIDLLFSHYVEPNLGIDQPVFLADFPPEMASLSKIRLNNEGEKVAARFELYINGLELANAYDELIDADTLKSRFEADNTERQRLNLITMPIDYRLLDALKHMPECSGIALGVDRLLMVLAHQSNINEVIAFPADIA